MMCALDSLSRFASVEEGQRARVIAFVQNFFPCEFSTFADTIYTGFRNGLVHEWFMTEVAFCPMMNRSPSKRMKLSQWVC